MMFMRVLTMYKDINNRKQIESILNRPEFATSVRSPESKEKIKQALKEILAMGETDIYQYIKNAYGIK